MCRDLVQNFNSALFACIKYIILYLSTQNFQTHDLAQLFLVSTLSAAPRGLLFSLADNSTVFDHSPPDDQNSRTCKDAIPQSATLEPTNYYTLDTRTRAPNFVPKYHSQHLHTFCLDNLEVWSHKSASSYSMRRHWYQSSSCKNGSKESAARSAICYLSNLCSPGTVSSQSSSASVGHTDVQERADSSLCPVTATAL